MGGTKRGRSKNCTRRAMKMESLEERRLLAGDLDIGPPAPIELEQFQSAEELKQFLIDDAVTRYADLFGQPGWQWRTMAPYLEDAAIPPPQAGAATLDHSETNTQVAGVDEGDIVETDGNYLYILSGQEVVIATSATPDQLAVASRVEIAGQPFAEFLSGDRLTVLSHSFDYIGVPEPWLAGPAFAPMIDIAYPCCLYEPTLNVTVLDVSDRAAPTLIEQTAVDGSYVDSRAIGDFLYLVTSDSFALPGPELHCEENPDKTDPDEPPPDDRLADPVIWLPPDTTCVYETREEYVQRVEGQSLDAWLPNFSSIGPDGEVARTGLLSEPTDIYKPRSADDMNLVSVVAFNVADDQPGPASSTSVPTTYASQVYASPESLYLANPQWGSGIVATQATAIFKFDIDSTRGDVELAAVGRVPGEPLNSFSIDEHEGYLRIATTEGWGENAQNRVFVLQETGDELETVGKTDLLAPGEQIYSVRFMGDRGYVVTFLRVDPLFALDLSNPKDPQVMGELKIPGFSNYLHPFQENYLIGIGYDADENTGRREQLQISLFDVSDLSNPQRVDQFSFDVPDWAWSEAISDHHAVGFYPEHQVLAIPISSGGGWVSIDRDGDGRDDVQTYRPRTELWVFQIGVPDGEATVKPGIHSRGQIEHESEIRRSVRIGDWLYTISDAAVTAHDILDPTTEVGRLHFGQGHVGVPVFLPAENDVDVAVALAAPETSAPQVVNVSLGSTKWDRDFVSFLASDSSGSMESGPVDTVTFSGIDRISVTFSEDVIVGQQDLSLLGVNTSKYEVRDFRYEADISTAVWTISNPMEADKLRLRMEDAVTDLGGNRLDGNGNGEAGGRFEYRVDVLPGEINGDGHVDRLDIIAALADSTSRIGDASYDAPRDVDGNGVIDAEDLQEIGRRSGTALPPSSPGESVLGDANLDGQFDPQDIVQVLQIGKFMTGEAATWRDGDWTGDGVFDQFDIVTALQNGTYSSREKLPIRVTGDVADLVFDQLGA